MSFDELVEQVINSKKINREQSSVKIKQHSAVLKKNLHRQKKLKSEKFEFS